MQGLYLSMRWDLLSLSFHKESKGDPLFIPVDDTSDTSESENEEDGFFTLTDTKKYPCDEKVFLIYELKLLELIKSVYVVETCWHYTEN